MAYKFTIVKKGYNPDEVDAYIQGLESALKGYKEKEVAIKNALINAQLAADNIIKDAENNSAAMKRDTLLKLERISASLNDQKKVLDEFHTDYNRIMKKYLSEISESDFTKLYSKIDDLADTIEALSDDKYDSVSEYNNTSTFKPVSFSSVDTSGSLSDTKIFEVAPASSKAASKSTDTPHDDGIRELLKQ